MFDMRPLLIAIRTALRAGVAGVRDHDVYITGHENHIPRGTRFPCVGIKDGAIRRSEKVGGVVEAKVRVKVVVFAKLGSIDDGTSELQELAAAVHQVLDDNELGQPDVLNAFSPSEDEGDWFGGRDDIVLRKVITYEYETEGPRP